MTSHTDHTDPADQPNPAGLPDPATMLRAELAAVIYGATNWTRNGDAEAAAAAVVERLTSTGRLHLGDGEGQR